MSVSQGLTRIYTTADRDAWDALVTASCNYDFYHLADYHALAESRGEGRALLIEHRRRQDWIALPLLVVENSGLPGLEGTKVTDATSVYGYPGPISSDPRPPRELCEGFLDAVDHELQRFGVVSVFSRLHPLFDQWLLLDGRGKRVRDGTTVSIDLTIPAEEQRRRYRKDHKYGVNKLRRDGFVFTIDERRDHLEEFVGIYHENMRRVGAAEQYFFDSHYFENLLRMRNAQWCLALCTYGGRVVCGGVFSLCNGIVQYHLSATATSFLRAAPMKLLIDGMRLWGCEVRAKWFHLGGGLGGKEDTLFKFKAGFSDRRHEFLTWRWVRDPDAYENLVDRRMRRLAKQEPHDVRYRGYFPEYRRPVRLGVQ